MNVLEKVPCFAEKWQERQELLKEGRVTRIDKVEWNVTIEHKAGKHYADGGYSWWGRLF